MNRTAMIETSAASALIAEFNIAMIIFCCIVSLFFLIESILGKSWDIEGRRAVQ